MVDRRIARTESAVLGAFELLLDEKGYNRMTVQDLLDASNVGRATFYAHFQGKEGVLESFVAGVIEHVASPESAEPAHDFTGRDGTAAQVEHALHHMQEHGRAVRALLVGGRSEEFVRALRIAAFERLRGMVSDGFIAHFLTGALVEMAIHWAETDFAENPGVLAESYARLTEMVIEDRCTRPAH